MVGQGFLHDPHVLVKMVDFDVQISGFNHGLPEEEQEEKHDEHNERPLHHVRQIQAHGKRWVLLMKKNLGTHQTVPHHQERYGVNSHDGKQHPGLVGKPAPADQRDHDLEKLEAVDGKDAVQSRDLCVASVDQLAGNGSKNQGKEAEENGRVVRTSPVVSQ